MSSFLIVLISMVVFALSLVLAETAAKRGAQGAVRSVVRPIPPAPPLTLRKEWLVSAPASAPAPKRAQPVWSVHAWRAQNTVAIG